MDATCDFCNLKGATMLDSTLNLLLYALVTLGGPALVIWLVWSIHRIRLALENIAREMRRSTGPRNTF